VRTWAAGHIHKDRKLSAEGPYALIRNPLYLGSALMALGFCLSVTNISFWGRTLLLWIFSGLGFYWMYQTKIQNEEIHLEDIFKEEYAHYRKNVPAMLPRKWAKWKIALDTSQFSWDKFNKNKEYKAWIGLFIIWVLLRFKLIYRI
ncbi:MAG: isoprenylcysteine carboxylmethyltransferase family protein, partial [Elusimicrobia bacterium]|nr:isoprenylcysteine carboxylmethyltransferase family protein [Elusimicrobiota bacterium]